MKKLPYLPLLFTALLSFFVITGCEEQLKPDEPASLELDPSDEIVFEAAGGTETVRVVSNRNWEVSAEESGHFSVQTLTDTTFSITAAPNESEEDIQAVTVTVTAGEGDDSVTETILVSQKGRSAVTLTLDPSEDIVFGAEGGTETITVTSNAEWTVESDNPDHFPVEKISETQFTVSAAANSDAEELPTATVTVTAGEDGAVQTATLKVSQLGPDPLVLTIILENITATSTDMTVTPSVETARYYFDVIQKSILNEHHSGDLAVYMENMMAEAINNYGSVEEAMNVLCDTGKQSWTFDNLRPETEYVAFAAGLNDEGKVSSEIASEEYTTLEMPGTSFEVEFSNTTYDGTDYTVTPNNDSVSYYHCVRPVAEYEDLSDEELMDAILAEDGFVIPFYSTSGVSEYTNEHVNLAGTRYMVLIFGVSGGYYDVVPTTEIFRFDYTTLSPETDPQDCTFDFEFTNITAKSADVKITPSDEYVPYIYDLIAEEDYLAYKDDMEGYVAEYIENNVTSIDYARCDGVQSYMYYQTLEPGTTYYNWVACIDEYGNLTADVVISPSFSTIPRQESTATVTAVVNQYFDGDELYEMYPDDYPDGQGKVYVSVTFTASEDAKTWYGEMVEEDPNDPTSAISDQEIAETLSYSGSWCPTEKLYWANWDTEHTILAVAIGPDENYSKVFRLTTTFTKEGANDISEFEKPEYPYYAPGHSRTELDSPVHMPKVVMYKSADSEPKKVSR